MTDKDFVDKVKKFIEEKYQRRRHIRCNSVEEVKKEIDSQYQKLFEPDLSVQDIREIFLPYTRDPESFLKLTDEEIYQFYTEWLKLNSPEEKPTTEMDCPDIDE